MDHPVRLIGADLRLELGLTAEVGTFTWAPRVEPFAPIRAQICVIAFRLAGTAIPFAGECRSVNT
jgi:hypothetical protein